MDACIKAKRLSIQILLAVAAFIVISCSSNRDNTLSTDASRIRHVFLIMLENKTFNDTFVSSTQDIYLRKTLVPTGGLLTQYYGIGHVSLDNYISLISGQAPTPDTAEDCVPGLSGDVGNYNDVKSTGRTSDGQIVATTGCVYPAEVTTLVDQLSAAGFSWKGYMEDMGNDPARESATCAHPPLGIGTDRTNAAEAPTAEVPSGDAYATRHDPFVYFHSIIDSPQCDKNVVNLNSLMDDLTAEDRTPNFSLITPNLCHDGHDGAGTGIAGTTCANGEPGGLTSADAFLHAWIPRIMASPAYKKDGLLIITFDEGNYAVTESTDVNSGRTTSNVVFSGEICCGQRPGPNLIGRRPSRITVVNTPKRIENVIVNGYGGDRVGALLLSPFIIPGSVSDTPYNHYALLGSLEDIFHLSEHLGYAAENPSIGYHLNTIVNDYHIFRRAGLEMHVTKTAPTNASKAPAPALN